MDVVNCWQYLPIIGEKNIAIAKSNRLLQNKYSHMQVIFSMQICNKLIQINICVKYVSLNNHVKIVTFAASIFAQYKNYYVQNTSISSSYANDEKVYAKYSKIVGK